MIKRLYRSFMLWLESLIHEERAEEDEHATWWRE